MAGKITVSTINDSSGVLATQNGMTGIAKAWVQFTGSSAAIQASFNVSSVTRNGTGDYSINYTTALTSASYAVSGSVQNYSTTVGTAPNVVSLSLNTNPNTSAVRVEVKYGGGGVVDLPYTSVIILGA
jgi:hypothetical protein